jgi:hypothetical protein
LSNCKFIASLNSNLKNTVRLLDIANKMLKNQSWIDIDEQLLLTDKLENLTIANLDPSFSQEEFNTADNINYQIALNFQEQRQLEYKLEKSKAADIIG